MSRLLVSVVLFAIFCAIGNLLKFNPNSPSRSIASIKNKDISGSLITEIQEDFGTNKVSYHNYIVDDYGKKHNVNSKLVEKNLIGKNVTLRGNKISAQSPVASTHWPQLLKNSEKMLIILVKYNTSPTTYLSKEKFDSQINKAFKPFFSDMIQGKMNLEVDTLGWYHIDKDEVNLVQSNEKCYISGSDIKELAAEYNIDLLKYDNITTIVNCNSHSSVHGKATLGKLDWLAIGKKQTWARLVGNPQALNGAENSYVPGWSNLMRILVHERGHNFGLGHSNALDCGTRDVLQGCNHYEYANKFDTMGAPDGGFVFNADQQNKAGWKNEATDFHHIKSSGSFKVDRLTSQSSDKKIGAYIYDHTGAKKIFMIEYRQGHGFDSYLKDWIFRDVWKGIHLYSNMGASAIDRSPKYTGQFRYIDSTPTQENWITDTAHESHQGVFFDPISGVRIAMDRIIGDKARFRVEYDEDNRVCYKKGLADKVTRPYLTRQYLREAKNTSTKKRRKTRALAPPQYIEQNIKSQHIVLEPGDEFKLKFDSLLADNIICPRTSMRIKWTNGATLSSWGPIFEEEENDYNDLIKPTLIGSGFIPAGSNTPFSLVRSFENYDKSYVFSDLLKVPTSALNKDYTLNFKIEDLETGNSIIKKVYLYIRSNRNTPIAIPADMDKEM